MSIPSIEKLNVKGKTVFVRADLNVPLSKEGGIADETRIQASLPTLRLLLENGASLVVASHLGRPKGAVVDSLSLRPIAKRLGELLEREVSLAPDSVGSKTQEMAQSLDAGDVMLLENLRFHSEEEANDKGFAEQLASLADVYVNDAFGTSHRAHASTEGITHFVSEKAAGLLLTKELEYFDKALENPARPLVAIFGGAKISTKMKALRNVAPKADKIIVGGAMANTFLAAKGLSVGKSLYEPEEVASAKEAAEYLASNACELLLPTDVIIAASLSSGVPTEAVAVDAIPEDMMALDIGPDSLETFKKAMEGAGTIVWNGPMGAFETSEFSSGTFGIIDALAEAPCMTVVGGGETDQALHTRHAIEKMSFVSTGGGAFLELLEGRALPGVEALRGA